MKNEPCSRLGIRISPKIREKPAESRNSKPPSAMLFTVSVSQRPIVVLLFPNPLAGEGHGGRYAAGIFTPSAELRSWIVPASGESLSRHACRFLKIGRITAPDA